VENSIKENSYWVVEKEEIVAICEICAKKNQEGWFWDGKRLGYGDYDLFCNKCNNAIYIRPNKND
jgi:hypothetical protein